MYDDVIQNKIVYSLSEFILHWIVFVVFKNLMTTFLPSCDI